MEILDRFRAHLALRTSSVATQNTYVSVARMYLAGNPGKHTTESFETFMSRSEGLSHNTMVLRYNALKKFFKFLEVTPPDLPRFGRYEIPREQPTVGSAEIGALMSAPMSAMEEAFVRTLFDTGRRIGEVALLTVEDVRAIPGMIRFSILKKGLQVTQNVPVTQDTIYAIDRHLARIGRVGGSVFDLKHKQPYAILKRVCHRAGIPYHSPHAFRHGRNDDLRRQGVALEKRAKFLGHASVEVTRRYDHIGDAEMSATIPPPRWKA